MAKKKSLLTLDDKRKPPALRDPARAARFIAGESERAGKSEEPAWEKLVFYVPPSLARAFRLYCADQHIKLSAAGVEAVEAFLRGKKSPL